MKGAALAAIIICIVAVAGAGTAIAVVNHTESYSIDYILDGGVNSDENPSSYKAGDAFTFRPATRDGYTFAGWFTDPEYKIEIKEITSDSRCNYTLYAKWTDVFTISYVLDGGVNSDENLSSYKAGDAFTFRPATRDGYTFAGWFTDPEYKNEIKEITSDSRCNYTLYAKWDANTYSITYVLNGGTNHSDNPSSYRTGDSISFKDPYREEYVFSGWFLDPEFKKVTTGITSSSFGDVTVYAQWNVSSVGTVLNYNMNGSISGAFQGMTRTITGSVSYSYLYYKYEKGYLMSYSESYDIKENDKTIKSVSDSDTYWTSENEKMAWTLRAETETISTIDGTKECRVWVGSYQSETEVQYEGIDNGRTYRIDYLKSTIFSTTKITYELTGVGSIEIDKEYEVKAYCDVGITVTGCGVNPAYSEVTLTASASPGTTFSGWYTATGTLVSTSEQFVVDTLLSDVTVFAMNDVDVDLPYPTTDVSISPAVSLTDVKWTFNDPDTMTESGDILNHTFKQGGKYTVIYEGKTENDTLYYGLYNILADGLVTKSYEWKYNGETYKTDLNIRYSDFKAYRDDDISRKQGSDKHNLEFVTYTDKYIVELADILKSKASGMTDLEFVNFILKFTQYIEYQYDEISMGQDEYWKYPVETLFDQNGDCEDTSILFCAIAKASGFDCCEILFSGHMAAGVVISGCEGSNVFVKNDVTYYYCETTSYDSVGDYITKKGVIDYRYTQYGSGSLFRKLTAVV